MTEQTDAVELTAAPKVTITLSIADLLAEGRLVEYDDYGDPIYSSSFLGQVVSHAADRIAREMLGKIDGQVREQVSALVHERITAALDRGGVAERDVFGAPKGPVKTLGEYLADTAADEVRSWMTGTDGYSRGKYRDFIAREVDKAVAADLKGVVQQARAEIRARMDAAAVAAISDAAAAAVRGL